MSWWIWLAACGLFCLALASLKSRRAIAPPELRGAKVIANERSFAISQPVRLHGRPDQVLCLKSGVLAVLDTKRRAAPRVFESDRVQLSGNRMLIAGQRKFRRSTVAAFGYIRFVDDKRNVKIVRVDLYTDAEVVRRYRRAAAIDARRIAPKPTPSPALCRGCGHVYRCDAAMVRKVK